MALIEEILAANDNFCANKPDEFKAYENEDHHDSKLPKKKLAILTCMDTRTTLFLEPAMGIKRGDAKIIKTVGNCVTGYFDTAVKSLLVAIYELGVQEIAVVGHSECGMQKTTAESLTKAMLARGISPDAIKMVEKELKDWADGFKDPEQNVKDVVQLLKDDPLIPKDVKVHGLLFHPRTGKLTLISKDE